MGMISFNYPETREGTNKFRVAADIHIPTCRRFDKMVRELDKKQETQLYRAVCLEEAMEDWVVKNGGKVPKKRKSVVKKAKARTKAKAKVPAKAKAKTAVKTEAVTNGQ